MISRIASIVFFLLFAINSFVAIPSIAVILGITAFVIAVALISGQ